MLNVKSLNKSKVGELNPFFGKKHSEETKLKMSRAKIGLRAEETNRWRGSLAKYRALHMWVVSRLGKANFCSKDKNHKSSIYDWANISGEYKRDLNDWWSLCRKCNKNDGIKIPVRLQNKGGSDAI